jgi:FdhD protein
MHNVVKEEPLSIFINGTHFRTAMLSPYMRKEFVIGHLFSEGIITAIEDIKSLQVDGPAAHVVTYNPVIVEQSGNELFMDQSKLPRIHSDLKIPASNVTNGVRSILESDLHHITGGVHVAGLFGREGSICISEDVGRHNALDKVIGYALLKNISFGETFVACTSRLSSGMSLKCVIARIPLIASRGATTSLAIDIADKTGLCIIGFVREERMNVYTHRWRVAE